MRERSPLTQKGKYRAKERESDECIGKTVIQSPYAGVAQNGKMNMQLFIYAVLYAFFFSLFFVFNFLGLNFSSEITLALSEQQLAAPL